MDLTEKQQAVFDFIKEYRAQKRRSPSYQEIRERFGFGSLNSVRKHLQQLERKGFIRTPWGNQKRAVQIVPDKLEPTPNVVLVPMLGLVSAGRPLDSPVGPETIEVPESLLRQGNYYGLRVRGSSMANDGIHDGDVLVVQRRDSAEPGQTVLALVDEGAVVKGFDPKDGQIELRTWNDREPPVRVDEARVQVRGVVVVLLRKYP